jgi:hypothetical protein
METPVDPIATCWYLRIHLRGNIFHFHIQRNAFYNEFVSKNPSLQKRVCHSFPSNESTCHNIIIVMYTNYVIYFINISFRVTENLSRHSLFLMSSWMLRVIWDCNRFPFPSLVGTLVASCSYSYCIIIVWFYVLVVLMLLVLIFPQ